MHIALFQPQIAPNTGNIIRLCANSDTRLHIIHPTGFVWEDKRLRRAALDYGEYTSIRHHHDWTAFAATLPGKTLWALTTHARRNLYDAKFGKDDVLLFGSETFGLGDKVHAAIDDERKLRLPMRAGSRSLNLSNCVAIVLYEALRQSGLPSDPALSGA